MLYTDLDLQSLTETMMYISQSYDCQALDVGQVVLSTNRVLE